MKTSQRINSRENMFGTQKSVNLIKSMLYKCPSDSLTVEPKLKDRNSCHVYLVSWFI